MFYRLASHFPSLAGEADDPYAEARANDWVNFLERYDEATVEDSFALLVKSWTKDRYPRIGDFQEIVRQRLARQASENSGRRALQRGSSGEQTYQCPGGCHDTGLLEHFSGRFDVGWQDRHVLVEASPERPVVTRCGACNPEPARA